MSNTVANEPYIFSLPGITCINCVLPAEAALQKIPRVRIEAPNTDVVARKISITVVDAGKLSRAEVSQILKDAIEDTGVECCEIINDPNTQQDEEQTIPEMPRQVLRKHIIKGLMGIIFGTVVIGLTLSGVGLPLGLMIAIVASGSLLTLYLGADSFKDAFKKFYKARTLTMDSLFTLGSLSIIASSIASFFVPGLAMMSEAGAFIFGFRHWGKAIEGKIKHKVTSGLVFKDNAAKTVLKKVTTNTIITWNECNANELAVGDIIRVNTNAIFPVDGTCLSENTSVYKTIINGSITPTEIKDDRYICAGMKVPEDVEYIELQVLRTVPQSYLARLDRKVAQTNKEKAPIETATTKALQIFIPVVLAFAAISWSIINFVLSSPAKAIQCATSVLVSLCPCTLGFITPLAVKFGIAKALENGIIFKSAKTLQQAAKVKTVIFDLNGTLTMGKPQVVPDQHKIYPGGINQPEEFFAILAAIELHSGHPIAKAIHAYAVPKAGTEFNFEAKSIDKTNHNGIKATINKAEYLVGNSQFLLDHGINIPANAVETVGAEQVVFLVKNQLVVGYVKLKDPLRPDAAQAIKELILMGVDVHVCSGADQKTVALYAKELNNLIPDANLHFNCPAIPDASKARTKTQCVAAIQANRKGVCMVGDAANDVLAIIKSNFGIAVNNTEDILTQEQAGAVINGSSLLQVVTTLAVARQTVKNIKQNLYLSLGYNMSMVLIAGGILLAVGFALNPAVGAALMIAQTAVILLNLYRIKRQQLAHLKRLQLQTAPGLENVVVAEAEPKSRCGLFNLYKTKKNPVGWASAQQSPAQQTTPQRRRTSALRA